MHARTHTREYTNRLNFGRQLHGGWAMNRMLEVDVKYNLNIGVTGVQQKRDTNTLYPD